LRTAFRILQGEQLRWFVALSARWLRALCCFAVTANGLSMRSARDSSAESNDGGPGAAKALRRTQDYRLDQAVMASNKAIS
jgi:hypothetical protein